MRDVTITVFTAVYNRKEEIENLYNSLKRQECYDFEWLIVDDGSSDHLDEKVEAWKREQDLFEINYFWKENGGKHTAINCGAGLANGKYFFICDSDDYLKDDAIKNLVCWDKLTDDESLAGLCGQRENSQGEYLLWQKDGAICRRYGGKPLFDVYIDANMHDAVEQYGLWGDRAEAFRTEVIRQYPFPEYEGERFCPESVIYNQMARDNLIFRWYNESLVVGDYRDDGMTNNIQDFLVKSPRAWADDIKYMIGDDTLLWSKMEEYYVYMRDTLSKEKIAEYLELPDCDKLMQIRMQNLKNIEEVFQVINTVETSLASTPAGSTGHSTLVKLKEQAVGMLMSIDYNFYLLFRDKGLEHASNKLMDEIAAEV